VLVISVSDEEIEAEKGGIGIAFSEQSYRTSFLISFQSPAMIGVCHSLNAVCIAHILHHQ